jgi:hypothetical protein
VVAFAFAFGGLRCGGGGALERRFARTGLGGVPVPGPGAVGATLVVAL